jgi:uncharacterized membrane protein
MDTYTLARVVHVVAVVVWIGGVSMVTTVLIPMLRKTRTKEDAVATFEQIEKRFSVQARITILLVGLSGFYMMYYLDAWPRYLEARYWWIHAMTLVWLLFTVMLFILEPFVLHKVFKRKAKENPDKVFSFMQRMHWVLLLLSFITIIGTVAGCHGWFFF